MTVSNQPLPCAIAQEKVQGPELQPQPARLPVVLRAAVVEDHPFIVDSWLISFRGSAIARDCPAYMHDMKWLIRRFLERVPVLVAVDEDGGAIWGWAATCGNTILYCYVREKFRRQGIAKMLLAPFLNRPDVVIAAKPPRDIFLPRGWRYSFLAGLRILDSR